MPKPEWRSVSVVGAWLQLSYAYEALTLDDGKYIRKPDQRLFSDIDTYIK